MSINSLTNAATARRPDFAPFNRVPNGLSEIALAAAGMPAGNSGDAAAVTTDKTTAANGVNTAMQILFGYIPTEILTLYVAVLGAIHPSGANSSPVIDGASAALAGMERGVFWSFLAATPVVVWVIYAAKLKGAGKEMPLGFSTWPLWEMFAATLAYVAWALALPEMPFHSIWYSTGLASVGVLITSTILGLLAPLFQNRLGT